LELGAVLVTGSGVDLVHKLRKREALLVRSELPVATRRGLAVRILGEGATGLIGAALILIGTAVVVLLAFGIALTDSHRVIHATLLSRDAAACVAAVHGGALAAVGSGLLGRDALIVRARPATFTGAQAWVRDISARGRHIRADLVIGLQLLRIIGGLVLVRAELEEETSRLLCSSVEVALDLLLAPQPTRTTNLACVLPALAFFTTKTRSAPLIPGFPRDSIRCIPRASTFSHAQSEERCEYKKAHCNQKAKE